MNQKDAKMQSFPWHIWEPHEGKLRFHSVEGQPGRLISGRLLPGSDFLLGMIEMAKSHNIRSAWVNGFGSLAKTNFSPGVRRMRTDPDRVERLPNIHLDGPIELWSGMGRLGIPDTGEPFVHFHGVVVTSDGQLCGGHFFPGGNPVYATCEVHLQELLGVEFKMQWDEDVQLPLIEPKPKT